MVFRLLKANLSNSSSRDVEGQQNKDTTKGLTSSGDTANWTFDKYVLGHKECHVTQDRLADDYWYQNFEPRAKVTWFTQGIKASEYTGVILQIHNNLNGSHTNFEKARELVSDFKQILDNQKSSRSRARGISEVHGGRRRGGGGNGSGGRGNGGRGGSGGRGWRFTYRTAKGSKEQLKAVKDADGGQATRRIAAKEHDDLAKLQTHIDKSYYPQKEFRMLESLERRKLDINCEGSAKKVSAVGTTAGPPAVPGNVRLISQETNISSIASVVTGMQKNVAVLIKSNNNSMRAISRLTRAVQGYEEPDDSATSEDLFGSDYDDEAHVRIRPKRVRKNINNPALARQKGNLDR